MGNFIRPRQRALTALSPHQGNRNVIVPRRLSLEPPSFGITVGTDGVNLRGFIRGSFGDIQETPGDLVVDRLTIHMVTNLIILQFSEGQRPLLGPIAIIDDQLADNRVAELVWNYEVGDNFFSVFQPTGERAAAWDAQLGSQVLIESRSIEQDLIHLWERSYTTTNSQDSNLGFIATGSINHTSSGANNNPKKFNPPWEWWAEGQNGNGALYEILASHVDGDVPSGTLDAWLNMGGAPNTWATQIAGITTSVIEVSIRQASDQELLLDRRRSFLVRAV